MVVSVPAPKAAIPSARPMGVSSMRVTHNADLYSAMAKQMRTKNRMTRIIVECFMRYDKFLYIISFDLFRV